MTSWNSCALWGVGRLEGAIVFSPWCKARPGNGPSYPVSKFAPIQGIGWRAYKYNTKPNSGPTLCGYLVDWLSDLPPYSPEARGLYRLEETALLEGQANFVRPRHFIKSMYFVAWWRQCLTRWVDPMKGPNSEAVVFRTEDLRPNIQRIFQPGPL